MKRSEVKIGGTYRCLVSGKLTTVRITKDRGEGSGGYSMRHKHQGWDAVNVATGRNVRIKTAAKLRGEAGPEKHLFIGWMKRPSLGGEIGCQQVTLDDVEPFVRDRLKNDPSIVRTARTLAPTHAEALAKFKAAWDGQGPNGDGLDDGGEPKQPEPDAPPAPRTVADVNRDQRREMEVAIGPVKERQYTEAEISEGGPKTGMGDVSYCPLCDAQTSHVPCPNCGYAEPTGTERLLKASLAERLKSHKPSDTGAPHLIVEARAGTGKTTTLVEGLKRVKGIESKLVPSPQQAAVWEAMTEGEQPKTVCFVAFNKSIATELQKRVPAGCDAMTMHSMGLKAVTRAFGRVNVDSYRVSDIIAEILEKDIRELRRNRPVLIKATEDLVGLCKQNLVGFFRCDRSSSDDAGQTWEALADLAAHYDVDCNGESREVFELVPRVLERCKDVQRDGKIDFNDMIWLPVALNLPVNKYDLLLVDEAQDLNKCQQQLALKAGKRLVLCGDPKQAIYGFAGADAESMNRMGQILGETDRGVKLLPLTVTRRCGKAIVAEAQKIVPDFDAFETNPEGTINYANYKEDQCRIEGSYLSEAGVTLTQKPSYHSIVQDGDMILCRVNAPLVSQCFRFLKAGRKANIQGRDIGQGLISTIKKLKAKDVAELVEKLSDWFNAESRKENAKRNHSEQRLIALQDRYDCLICFTEDARTVDDVTMKIERIFTDDKNGTGIRLSSIHRAKGLEASVVYLLEPEGATVPHPMAKSAWQRGQEMNLRYVAITRAINTLVFVR